MDDQDLALLLTSDANTLPYFLQEATTAVIVSVHFEPLIDDEAEIQGSTWVKARFRDVWLAWIGEEHTFKLVLDHDIEKHVQGIVRLGEVKRADFVGMTLRDSLLETAPDNRQNAFARLYRGVGSALVARMIVESYRQGAKGQLLVRPVTGSLPFYLHLGFQNMRRTNYYVLPATDAQTWLKTYFGKSSAI